ncbi:hypothetical protein FRB96_004569 [Tulasnella sp. 330]|nr:hypothetical protein FRB96_004569 [Tulasnella sp. 330]KAG8890854.1 hypothetical protein FRB98_004899 [Tulasnella sp. 332]
MKLNQLAQLFAVFASLVAATPLPELDIAAVASFPESNPFAHVVNGEKNKMTLEIENKSPSNVTLKSAAGSIHDPDSGKTTSLSYGVTLISGAKTVLPYNFNSEYKPREVLLKIWVNYDDGSSTGHHQTMAYDSVVTIVEPPSSFFDLPLLLSYAVLAVLIGGGGYLAFNNYAPKSVKKAIKKQRLGATSAPAKSEISEPIGRVKASSASGAYGEEWIPAHHRPKAAKKEGGLTSASSGEESGPDRKPRRKSSRRG